MMPLSLLELMPNSFSTCCTYLQKAASVSDPVERMKLVMAVSISFMLPNQGFEKPLNPVLGETYQAVCGDGTVVYMEQTSHHPPISSFLLEAPDGAYTISGWSGGSIWAGLNNATWTSSGYKKIVFRDGQTITFNPANDYFYNTFMGTLGHQMQGTVDFVDEKNDIKGTYTFGCIKRQY
jgi:hypothetical protein